MNKYKVAVYAISKNESKFVDRWYESMKEADSIYVLDTGSTDNTVELLKSHGIIVKQKKIIPWRFDVARNMSLDMLPDDTDICVCTDLDEVLVNGWREKLEASWNDANQLIYKYNWSLDEHDNPIVTFKYEKIHDRHHFKWIYPVHEVLECSLDKKLVSEDLSIVLNHYPDSTKSRSSYLPLLELAVKEYPDNDRIMHYLGREYMYYEKWNESIDTLIKHLNLKTSTWKEERCASLRFISRCYSHLNRIDEAILYAIKAIEECPNIREGYVELAFILFNQGKYFDCIYNLIKAKSIIKHDLVYINEPFCYDSTIDDLLSLCFYNIGLKDEAIFFVDKAIDINNDKRLINNKEIFLS